MGCSFRRTKFPYCKQILFLVAIVLELLKVIFFPSPFDLLVLIILIILLVLFYGNEFC